MVGTTAGGGSADVLVVGAGPAGSTAAFWLARAGLDVVLLEKATFPRDKVCGDGLTPRAVKALTDMGVDTDGWVRHRGLRVYGGGRVLELDWPQLVRWPGYSVVRPRRALDELLARHAAAADARLRQGVTVTEPLLDEAGRVAGVHATVGGTPVVWRAPLVVSAEGLSGRLAKAVGLTRRADRPLGVAVRRYYRTPRAHDTHLETYLELPGTSLPGYGWVFGLGDGTANVGVGVLDSRGAEGMDYRRLLGDWVAGLPPEWELDEAHALTPVRGAGLPMGLARRPAYTRGLLLAGDAAGTVSPFNGEGIGYAMETGRVAAEVATAALAQPPGPRREARLRRYPAALSAEYGAHHRLGAGFLALIGRPELLRFAAAHALKRPALMRAALKLVGNLSDGREGDAVDRAIATLTRLTPAA